MIFARRVRGLVDRNPGNVRVGSVSFVGQISQDAGFCVFDTADHGIRAVGVVLLTYYRLHGIRTITEAISRWAPPSENDTPTYIAHVCAWTGYGALNPLNFYDPAVLAKLVSAIIKQEVGFKYTDAQIAKSCAEAIGLPHPIMGVFNQGNAPVTIAVMNRATVPLGVDFDKLIAAMQAYVGLYLYPSWGFRARLVKSLDFIPGAWAMVFLDDADQPGALAYHDLTPDGLPQSKVFVKTTLAAGELVSVSASHELAEMAGDPAIQLMASRNDVNTLVALETCDPCESETFFVNGIPMSDFVHPAYFEGFREPHSVRFDHMGKITAPFQVLPGGYQITLSGGQWSQVFGSTNKALAFAREDRRGHRSEMRKRKLIPADPVAIEGGQ